MSFSMTHHNQLTTLSDISIFQVQPSIETRSIVPLLFVRLPSLASNSLTTLAQEAASHSSLITLDQTESVQAIKSFPASTHIILITPNPSPATDPPPSHPMVTRSKNHIIKPKKFTNGNVRFPLPSVLLAKSTDVVSCPEPTCYTSAVKDPNQRVAMNLRV